MVARRKPIEHAVEQECVATRCQPGDLWQMGAHTLLCGDSTNAADLARLMRGAVAEMLFTDPPYGVRYDGGHFHSEKPNILHKRERLTADNDTGIYARFLPTVLRHVKGPCYVWFAATEGNALYRALDANRCQIHSLIIWNKVNATYAAMRATYKQRHEVCLYFKPRGATLRWSGPTNERSIWEVKRDAKNIYHPTQKPVELALRALRNHRASTVLDVFAGSGSTIIAAEREGRACYAMEIEPRYCDVILQRWERETGERAVLLDDTASPTPALRVVRALSAPQVNHVNQPQQLALM